MKATSSLLLVAALGLSVLGGCKKDDNSTPAPSKTDLLTAKKWQATDIKIGGQSIYNTPLVSACDKDDLTKFNTDKSVTFEDGSLKCDPTAPQSTTGKWEFTSSESKLKITDSSGDVSEGTINTLNSTTLIVSEPDFMGTGQTAEVTFTAR